MKDAFPHPDLLWNGFIALVSAWIGAYIGYRFAFRFSRIQEHEKLSNEVDAVIFEMSAISDLIDPDGELALAKQNLVLSNGNLRVDALRHFISSGTYLALRDTQLNSMLIRLNQKIAKADAVGEAYLSFVLGLRRVMSIQPGNVDPAFQMASALIAERKQIKSAIDQVVPILQKAKPH